MKGLFQCPPLYIAWNFKASALSGRMECSCKLEYIKLWIYK